MPLNNRVGGYRYDLEDRQWLEKHAMSFHQLMAAVSDLSIPDEVDPTGWFKIRNQGQEGSCQGHAISACGEECFHVASQGNVTRFSPDAAYYLTQKLDGLLGRDNGSTIAGGMKMAMQTGFCPEPAMPYSDRYNPGDLPKNITELCEPYKVFNHIVLDGPDYFAQAVKWLGAGFGAISIGIDWGVQLDSQGFAHWAAANAGGHANALLGYGGPKDANGLPQFLWDANSWDVTWGPLGGWCKWTRDQFNRAMAHRYSVGIGISDMRDVKPRKVSWAQNFPA